MLLLPDVLGHPLHSTVLLWGCTVLNLERRPGMSQEGLSASLHFQFQPKSVALFLSVRGSVEDPPGERSPLQEGGVPVNLARMRLCLLQLAGDQVFNYSATWPKIFSASFLKTSHSLGLQIFSFHLFFFFFVCVCVRERERERNIEHVCECEVLCACVLI